jgi:hypothetical protein
MLCTYFQVGRCAYGAKCRNIHDRAADSAARTLSVPCKYFAGGGCYFGDSCLYSHDPISAPEVLELASPEEIDSRRNPNRPFCMFGKSCEKGSACRFQHESDPEPTHPTVSISPCNQLSFAN